MDPGAGTLSKRSGGTVDKIILAAVFLGMLAGMILFMEAGYRIARRRMARNPAMERPGLGVVEGAMFALLGLILAFTFSGAASRFDARRHLVGEEANAIGTAYLRLDLLPENRRAELKGDFRRYLEGRIELFRSAGDAKRVRDLSAGNRALQAKIWTAATKAAEEAGGAAPILLLPALNAMIDITTTREVATMTHPPITVFILMGGVALVCAILAGYAMAGARRQSWLHWAGFAMILAITMAAIIDIEYPRRGLIRVDSVDKVMVELLQSMK